ncbi:MAG: hypothetical protein B7Z06_06365 [Flavobacteriales bacterium 32-35-8]|nr:MAG: hypothetical protein B7Z06_06365 [Flavobacteriales bacterium 32-35-8]
MNEFLNRIDAQRKVIKMINDNSFKFPLVGLSTKSIDRWKRENEIKNDSSTLNLLIEISSKLFFLSNKSQEQITQDYKIKSNEVSELIDSLENKIKK